MPVEGARERREFHWPSAGVTFAVDKGKLPQQHVMGKEMNFGLFRGMARYFRHRAVDGDAIYAGATNVFASFTTAFRRSNTR